uniref:AB hydrolase-1 domain-containing protein n=1 Tax=Bursaphelenchus xylophilus TaxID=6326 RepID=A0A1I7SFE9_BURXY
MTRMLVAESQPQTGQVAKPPSDIPEPIIEAYAEINDLPIGYCRYGHGPYVFLFICGGVGQLFTLPIAKLCILNSLILHIMNFYHEFLGCYKKDFPENVLRAFDPNFATIICFDPPGYGKSRPPDRKQEVQLNKKDAKFGIALMKHLNLVPFSCLGWSEGGRTAIHLAQLAPRECNSVILLSTSTQIDFRGDMAFKGMRNTDQWLPNAKETYLAHYSEEFLREQWAALCDLVSTVYKDLGGRFPSDMILSQVKQPVLIVNGGTDRFILDPKHMTDKLQNASIQTFRVEVHAQGGHDLHIKYPRWFAIKLTQFVRENTQKKLHK